MGLEKMANQAVKETGGTPLPQNQVLDFLTKYIPGEVIALYIPVVAALPAIEKVNATFSAADAGKWVYWVFVIVSPFLFLFTYMTRAPREELMRLRNPRNWPLFRMAATFIAFGIWALAVPANPVLGTNALGALVAGVLAPIVSFFLSGIELIMNRFYPPPGGSTV